MQGVITILLGVSGLVWTGASLKYNGVTSGRSTYRGTVPHHLPWLGSVPLRSRSGARVAMSSTEEFSASAEKATKSKPAGTKVDFSSFAVGQQYDGELMSAKAFGIFVDISKGHNVLIPRSKISAGNFAKLKELVDASNKDKVKIEITEVDPEKQTLSGKYVDPNYKERKVADLSKFELGQVVNGKVVSTHEFGVFVNLEEFDCDGLLPMSRIRGVTLAKGDSIEVKIDQIDKEKNKLVLALTKDASGTAPMAGMSPERWLQGIVTSVSSFGLFVRPAGMDMTGLVHTSRIPRDLVSVLKKRVTVPSGANKTDCEMLFQSGDVVKVRVNGVNNGKTELSMLPYRANEEDEDDYVVEGRDPEEEEGKSGFQDKSDDEDNLDNYDAQDTLLWWQGAPYVKSVVSTAAEVDEEAEVVMESKAVVEGTWRRMFEVDMREDQADFSTKVREADLKEMEEEIGELSGLDEDLLDSDGMGALGAGGANFRMSSNAARIGNYVSGTTVPKEWSDKIDFFKDVFSAESTKVTALKKGKSAEQSEFEALLREVEVELEAMSARQPRKPAAEADVATVATTEAAPAAPAS